MKVKQLQMLLRAFAQRMQTLAEAPNLGIDIKDWNDALYSELARMQHCVAALDIQEILAGARMANQGNLSESEKLKRCVGCRDNYYNCSNSKCWSLATARPVKRWKIDWWQEPVSKEVFTQIETLHCHHAPGQYALSDSLPEHILKMEAQVESPAKNDR